MSAWRWPSRAARAVGGGSRQRSSPVCQLRPPPRPRAKGLSALPFFTDAPSHPSYSTLRTRSSARDGRTSPAERPDRSGREVEPLGLGAGEVVAHVLAVLSLDVDSTARLAIIAGSRPVDVDDVLAHHERSRAVLILVQYKALPVVGNESTEVRARTGSKVSEIGGEASSVGAGASTVGRHRVVRRLLRVPTSADKSGKGRCHEHDRGEHLHR
ncbi:hypothetical protein L1887_50663 [Cichorium endivia]|nr:hypothetical protein L1887_50663 [Cichorium endivia]